jgi:hypothetical protein
MSQTIKVKNFSDINVLEYTQLTSDIASSVTSLPVENSQDFGANDYALVGTPGSKTSELFLVDSAPSTTSITIDTATGLDHNAYEPVTRLFGNQINIYRAANVDGSAPADLAYSLLATIDIDPNDADTIYTDATGGGGYWYKYTFLNVATSAESDRPSANAVRGNFTVAYCSLDEIRQEAGFKYATYIDDIQIDAKRQAAQSEINSTLSSYYDVPFSAPISPLLSDICKRLAAGLLLQEQYRRVSDPDTNGTNKLTQVRADLQKLIHPELSGTPLLDANGQNIALPNPNTSGSGWPDATTTDSDPSAGGAQRYFRMGMVEGYRSRDF